MDASVAAYRDPWQERPDPATPGQFRTALPLTVLPQVPVRGMTARLGSGPTTIPLGEGRAYAVDGERSPSSGCATARLRAVSAVCPHRGGPLADGQIDLRQVVCPLHLNACDLDHRLLADRPARPHRLPGPRGRRPDPSWET